MSDRRVERDASACKDARVASMERTNHDRHVVPGGLILHPVALAALAVLVVNDHWLKSAFGNAITGKLSDFAGLALFPLVLVGGFEWICRALGRFSRPSRIALVVATVATGIVFSAVKLLPEAAEIYRIGVGALWWPAHGIRAMALGDELPALPRAAIVLDASDLVALAALALPLAIGLARSDRTHSQ